MAILVGPGRGLAANINWTGNTDTDWQTSTNWTTGTPTSSDSVTIDTTSPHAPVIDGTAAASGSLAVGQNGNATLTIQNAGSLSSGSAQLGVTAGSTGAVTVTNIGSSWSLGNNDLDVGYGGQGILTLTNGASLSDHQGSLGRAATGTGQVTVSNGASWTNTGNLLVGNTGNGWLAITSGGQVTNAWGQISASTNSVGLVTVDGAGSTWTNTTGLQIGSFADGSLRVTNGGQVNSNAAADIAAATGSTGAVTVDGAGSQLNIATSFNVGSLGSGTLAIQNGGLVTSRDATVAGSTNDSTGAVIVDGTNSKWQITTTLVVGGWGTGSLLITNGASVTDRSAEIGNVAGSSGAVTVDNASWTTSGFPGTVVVGVDGQGAMTVRNGGYVGSGGVLQIAQNAGSTGIVNIGADPSSAAAAPGTLDVASVQFGAGVGTFNFNHTGTGYDFAPAFAGSGTINHIAGDTILSADSSSFTGATNVTGGRLAVNGSLANSMLTVSGTGTLAGAGTVGNTQVNSGGTFAPGSGTPGSSITVAGNLAFQSGAMYLVQVNPSAASFANVTGSASLAGTVQLAFANGSYVSKTYTVLTASGGVSGTFAPTTVNTNLPTSFKTALGYDANNVYLDLTLAFDPSPGSGLNANQKAVANTLTNYFNSNGGIPLVYGGLTPAGLTQASGELATGSQQTTFNAMGQFMGLLTDPSMHRGVVPGSTSAPAGFAEEGAGAGAASRRTDAFAMFSKAPLASFMPRWSVWAAGFGGSQSTDGNAVTGSNNTTSSIYGTAIGADYLFSPNTLAGFSLAGGGTNFSVNGLGSGRSDLFQAGAYARHTTGPAYVSAALAYGWQDITTDRTLTIAGIDHLRAEFNANAWSGRVEGGYRLVEPWTGGIGVTPYAAAQFTTFDLPAYAEQLISGAGNFALAYASKSVTATRSELGLRTDKSFGLADGVLTLRSRFAWAHDFNPDRSIAATFQALPGASFVVDGAAQAADAALVTASAEMKWLNGWSAAATFEGEFSNVTRSYAGKGMVRYQW